MVGPPMSLNLLLGPPRLNFCGAVSGLVWVRVRDRARGFIPLLFNPLDAILILRLVQLVLRRSEEMLCTVPSYRQFQRRHIAEDWAGMNWVRARFHGALKTSVLLSMYMPLFLLWHTIVKL